MIGQDDLRAGVASGILTEAQASRMIALADSRRGARENLAPGDEPFELFKGFNEVFIVVGLIILGLGWFGVAAAAIGDKLHGFDQSVIFVSCLTALVLWGLSEYFIRRRRMIAPAILLTGFWATNAAIGGFFLFAHVFMVAQGDYSSLPGPMAFTTFALLVFWWRFRVPIALSAVALSIFAIAVTATGASGERIDSPRDLFLLSGQGFVAWITLALGLAVFAVAMIFDMSDPHRVTRRSANGFWLHIIAAPAIVNTVALTLLTDGGSNLWLAIFLLFIALAAIVIDRRSFLIAAVGYVVALAGSLNDGIADTGWSVLFLGVALLLTGSFWERIRARLLNTFAFALPLDRLPPAQ